MTGRTASPKVNDALVPKGAIADHWTNRAERGAPPTFVVTGWHFPERRKAKAEPEHKPSGRGAVRETPKPTQRSLL